MKKLNFILAIIFIMVSLSGCALQDPKYINLSTKPNNHYYTDEIHRKILNNESFKLYVFNTNLYKSLEVSSDENIIIENFIQSLVSDNYLDENVESKEPYKIKIVFKDAKFLIKVFNNSTISISPWDGNYKEDVISIKDLPLAYNLYDFCTHIENKPLER